MKDELSKKRVFKVRYDWHFDLDEGVLGQTSQSEFIFTTEEEDEEKVREVAISKIKKEEEQYGGGLADFELYELGKDEVRNINERKK